MTKATSMQALKVITINPIKKAKNELDFFLELHAKLFQSNLKNPKVMEFVAQKQYEKFVTYCENVNVTS